MKRMSLYKMICYCCLIWGTMACTKEDTPEAMWEYDYGYQTIEMIRQAVDMYPLTVEGLGRGLKKLVSTR